MEVQKRFGQVYGAKLTAAEKKAIDIEIQKELAEYNSNHSTELDAIFLYQLHEQLGFGIDRLRRFYEGFAPAVRALTERYLMETEEEKIWICTHKLKELGVDLEKWSAEINEKENL